MGDNPKTKEGTESQEDKEVSQEAASDSVDTGSEASEVVDKLPAEASEKSSEDKAVSQGGAKGDDDDQAAITASLKKKLPPRRVMKRQVHDALVKQENILLKQARKHSRSGDFFELNNVLQKIREIRLILADLAKATLENIKKLWFKYVKSA